MWPSLWLSLENISLSFEQVETNFFFFLMLHPSSHTICSLGQLSDVPCCSLSFFYLGPPVINCQQLFPFTLTWNFSQNWKTTAVTTVHAFLKPYPFWISVVGLIEFSTCSGINSHCRWFPESLSFKNHSGSYKGKPLNKFMSRFTEAVCMLVKYMDHGGWLLAVNPDPTPSHVNLNKLLKFSVPLFPYL